MIRAALILILISIVSNTAHAAYSGDFHIGLAGGTGFTKTANGIMSFPNMKSIKPTDAVFIEFDPAIIFAIEGGYALTKFLKIDAELTIAKSRFYFMGKESFPLSDTLDQPADSIFAGSYITAEADMGSNFVPFVGAGMGYNSVDLVGYSAAGIVKILKGGLEIALTEYTSVTLQYSYKTQNDLNYYMTTTKSVIEGVTVPEGETVYYAMPKLKVHQGYIAYRIYF